MSLSEKALMTKKFNRYSEGALYSQKELLQVINELKHDGFEDSQDASDSGMGVCRFVRELDEGCMDTVYIHLDSYGCSPNDSGSMIFVCDGEDARLTTMWSFLKEREPSAVKYFINNIKRMFEY